jgi:opacity protein-like surface antigen
MEMKQKYVWVMILLLAGVLSPKALQAQVSIYGEFSASEFNNLATNNLLYGATTGVLYDGAKIYGRVIVAADIQGRFVRILGQSLNGITIGPRFEVPLRHGWAPYGEFTVGFARYDSAPTGATTDSTIQLNAGLAKQLTSHIDAVADYSYSQYYGLGGQYNPKTFSIGGIYHFTKR